MDISLERYVEHLVKFLEDVGYHENGHSRDECASDLRYVFHGTMKHFSQPRVRDVLRDRDHERLPSAIRTITRVVVFCWVKVPRDVKVALTIYLVYILLGDDISEEPSSYMESFVDGFLQGSEQRHPIWRLLFKFFPEVLGHYGSFTRLTMVKSTLEFIQGCWADRQGFQGFPGSREYPMFLRRLNGLGDVCGATLFPTVQFDEDASFEDLTTVIAQLEPIVALVNDLFSFYKETGAEEGGLVRNLCRVDGFVCRPGFGAGS